MNIGGTVAHRGIVPSASSRSNFSSSKSGHSATSSMTVHPFGKSLHMCS
jgi:hypothetical protein